MAVYKRTYTDEHGKPSLVYWIDFYFQGKRYRRSAGTDHKEAKKALDRILGRIASGDFDPGELEPKAAEPGVLFERALEIYLEHRVAEGKTLDSYVFLCRLWATKLAGRALSTITREEIEATLTRWAASRKWAPATRNGALRQINGLLSFAVAREWIERHPTERGRVPMLSEDNAREAWLRPEDLEAVMRNAPKWLRPIIRFASMTAMRLGEILSLSRADYHEGEGDNAYFVTMRTKNGERLVWPLEGWAREYVKARVDECKFPGDRLFPGPPGREIRGAIMEAFPSAVRAAGIEYGRTRHGITFHSLRRTAATLALNAGVPEAVVQKLGNWKDRQMVALYAKVADSALRDATRPGPSPRGSATVTLWSRWKRHGVRLPPPLPP